MNNYDLVPLGVNIIVEKWVAPTEEKSEGGIVLPNPTDFKVVVSKVLSVGSECKYLKAGDLVAYEPHVITPLVYKGVEYSMTKEDYIVAKIAVAQA